MTKSIRKWVAISERHDEHFDGNFDELDGYYKNDSSMKNIYYSYKVHDGEVIEDAWTSSKYRCPACDTVG